MELTNEYLDKMTMMASFWIADRDNKIQNFANEGITIEKSKIYLNKFMINIYIKKEHYGELDLFANGWEKKYPKAVITKASGRVEAYELTFKKAVEKENSYILEFVGDPID